MRFGTLLKIGALLLMRLDVSPAKSFSDPLMFSFAGYIDFLNENLELDESVTLGTPFSGSYRFEPFEVADLYLDNPRVGAYDFGSGGHAHVLIGNYDFITNDLGMFITNDLLSGDVYQIANVSPFAAAGIQWGDMSVVLRDETRTALNSDALFTSVPDLTAFGSFRGLVLASPAGTLGIRGVLTSLTPEPDSLALLAFGGAFLSRRRRC